MKTKNNKMLILVAIAIPLIFSACQTRKHAKLSDYSMNFNPPGTVKIANNLYYDQTENRNLDYVEYLYWTKRVFGSESKEYLSGLPDTTAWIQDYPCLSRYVSNYFNHPSFRSFPVVGISKKQAELYSQWRSDRVFEMLLVGFGKLKFNQNQNRENYFSVINYITGKYNNTPPDTSIHYYPQYFLPDLEHWRLALKYNDSIRAKYGDKLAPEVFQTELIPCLNDSVWHQPTRGIHENKNNLKYLLIVDLKGNVREMTSADSISLGGSWFDKSITVSKQDAFISNKPNAYTGFRDACRWVEY